MSNMSLKELSNLLKYIASNHSPELIMDDSIELGWKQVTSVHPNINFRTLQCYSVGIHGSDVTGDFKVEITTENEFKDVKTPLYDRVVDFLQSKDAKTVLTADMMRDHEELDDLAKKVIQIVERQACIKVLKLDELICNYGADSMDMVEIVMALEDEFEFEVRNDYEYEDAHTTQDLINLVVKHTRTLQQQ